MWLNGWMVLIKHPSTHDLGTPRPSPILEWFDMRTCIYTRCTGTSTLLHSLDTQDIDAHSHTHTYMQNTHINRNAWWDRNTHIQIKKRRTRTHAQTHTHTYGWFVTVHTYTHTHTQNTLSWMDCHDISWNTRLSVVHVSSWFPFRDVVYISTSGLHVNICEWSSPQKVMIQLSRGEHRLFQVNTHFPGKCPLCQGEPLHQSHWGEVS